MKSDFDSRTVVLIGFILVIIFSSMVISSLTLFGVIAPRPLQDWRLLDRIFAILRCAALAASGVLVIVFFGIKRFALFSHLDKILTHLPVAAFGLVLIIFASYTVLTKAYDYHRGLLGLSDTASMLIGSFLCCWVFLFYGRESSDHGG